MKLRSLIVEVVTRWTGEAKLKAVKTLGDAAAISLRGLDQAAESMAKGVERSAARTAAAMREIAGAAREVRGASRFGDGSAPARGTAAPRVRDEGLAASRAANKQATKRPPKGGDDLDKAIAAANKEAASKEAAAAKHAADKASRSAKSSAMNAGFAAGSVDVNAASAALGSFASKTDVAKAKIADLTSKVERNRKEKVALKEQTLKAGDADGTLAARMAGLSLATEKTQIALSKAKRELTALNGGLIATIKSTLGAKVTIAALGHAAGNALSGAMSGAFNGVRGMIAGATEKAMDFQTSLVGIQKVARGTDDTAEGFARIKAGITATSKELGVLPTEVSDLTAQLAPAFSGVKEGVDGVAVDIVGLTNDVTKIGVAWGITGMAAGKSFAEISSGLQLTTTQTKSLFGGINEVGNQLGVNAATLAEAVQRSAGVLKGANIAGETGAALSAVLIKTGSSAEVAATGVRTFLGRLGAGETKGQLKAFETLGLDMKNLRKELTNGDAEGQIKKVVGALAGLKNEQRLEVLSELFGTESIGSIGAAANATDLLAQSMAIMGDKTAAATSVQKEYDRVSNTSAAKVAKLKANIEVLAISFGEKLMPYVDKVVDFLTSPEGQEWGAQAVEKLVSVVTGLADVIGGVIGFFGKLVDMIGGTGTAVVGLGLAVAAMTGPWGLLATVAVGALAAILSNAGSVVSKVDELADSLFNLNGVSLSGIATEIFGLGGAMAIAQQKIDEAAGRKRRAADDKELDDELNKPTGPTYGYGASPTAVAPPGMTVKEVGAKTASGDKQARFNALSAKIRRREKLRPSEVTEYNELSKSLDEAKATKGRKGGSTWTEEQKKIIAEEKGLMKGGAGDVIDVSRTDYARRLAGAGKFAENARVADMASKYPQLARVVAQGRAVDKKGKLAGAGNELDKALEDRAEHLPGMNVGVSGARGSSATAPPAMSNTYDQRVTNHNSIHFEQDITTTSSSPTPDGRIRAAGREIHEQTLTGIQEAVIVFTGGPRG